MSDDLETVFFGNLAIVAVSGSVATVTYFALNVVALGGTVVSIPVLLGLLIGIATLIPLVESNRTTDLRRASNGDVAL